MRRRFRFALERLGRVRALEERIARAAWGRAEGDARRAEAAAASAREALDGAQQELASELAAGALDARRVLAEHRVLSGLGKALGARREGALTRRGQAERLADAWRRRRADSEALTRLRERARQAHARDRARHDAALLDELTLARSFAAPAPGARGLPGPDGPDPHRAPAAADGQPI